MCSDNGFPIRSNLISDVDKTRSYITNALLPLLDILDSAGCEQVGCVIEIFNEPEWCVADARLDQCRAKECVSATDMQRFIAACTHAIHAHSPGLKVTVGSASLKWSGAETADGRSVADLWADAPLLAAFESLPAAYRELQKRLLCADEPPSPEHSCAEQRAWEKCESGFMVGHCCSTCFSCAAGCGGNAPADVVPTVSSKRDELLTKAQPRPTLDLYNVHFWNWMERTDGFVGCSRARINAVRCAKRAKHGQGQLHASPN